MLLDEKDGCARAIDACCPADPVDVVVGILRGVYLDDVVDVVKVYASGDYISCHQTSIFASCKTA